MLQFCRRCVVAEAAQYVYVPIDLPTDGNLVMK
jgi:hypothetical protein